MKAYTDLEQSKKLAEILPVESADMEYLLEQWIDEKTGRHKEEFYEIPVVKVDDDPLQPITLNCWSLAALFKLLPKSIEGAEPSLIKTFRDDYRIVYDIYGDENITSEDYTNPIDACYEMIIRLKEKDLI